MVTAVIAMLKYSFIVETMIVKRFESQNCDLVVVAIAVAVKFYQCDCKREFKYFLLKLQGSAASLRIYIV